MVAARLVECSFLIPRYRDAEISDGAPQTPKAWRWLQNQLYEPFEGHTISPGWQKGAWKNPQTGVPVADQSRKYTVAVPLKHLPVLRQMLAEACTVFAQRCIYLSVAGQVEFVEGPEHGTRE